MTDTLPTTTIPIYPGFGLAYNICKVHTMSLGCRTDVVNSCTHAHTCTHSVFFACCSLCVKLTLGANYESPASTKCRKCIFSDAF